MRGVLLSGLCLHLALGVDPRAFRRAADDRAEHQSSKGSLIRCIRTLGKEFTPRLVRIGDDRVHRVLRMGCSLFAQTFLDQIFCNPALDRRCPPSIDDDTKGQQLSRDFNRALCHAANIGLSVRRPPRAILGIGLRLGKNASTGKAGRGVSRRHGQGDARRHDRQ